MWIQRPAPGIKMFSPKSEWKHPFENQEVTPFLYMYITIGQFFFFLFSQGRVLAVHF